jgi:amicyanin
MKKAAIFLGFLVVLLMILPGCSNSYSSSSTSSAPATNNNSDSGAQSISIKGFAFIPKELTINKGDTVTWTNEDAAVHNVVGGIFQSKDLAQGQTFSYKFTDAGTYDYSCGHHPSMQGKIIVK